MKGEDTFLEKLYNICVINNTVQKWLRNIICMLKSNYQKLKSPSQELRNSSENSFIKIVFGIVEFGMASSVRRKEVELIYKTLKDILQ